MQPEAGSQQNRAGLPSSRGAERVDEPGDLGHVRHRRVGSKWLRRTGVAACCILLVPLNLWALAALYFDVGVHALKVLLPLIYLGAVIAIWVILRRRFLLASGLTLGCFMLVCAWWLTLQPSNEREWQRDVAVTPFAEVNGGTVSLHNIRFCKYRTETDYDVDYYDKAVDLNAIRTVDLYLVYWGSPLIAHTMASFGFDDGQYICVSIETRKERGENYSALRGFFRQFELIYVIADERDLVRLRTNFRNEEVHLFRINESQEGVRNLFLEYLRAANDLHERPKWYNALTGNCTTNIRLHAENSRRRRTPLDWRVIVNGYSDQMLYERGRIDTSMPFEELKRRSLINERARSAPDDSFSEEIRRGLPGIKA